MDLRAGGVSKPLARRESIGKTVRSPPCVGGAPEYNHYEIRFFGYTHCPCFKSGKGLFLRRAGRGSNCGPFTRDPFHFPSGAFKRIRENQRENDGRLGSVGSAG